MKNITFLFLFAGLLSNAQNLVLNPGFETATVGIPTGTPIPMYPTFLDDWSAVSTDGEFMYDVSLAHSGTGFLSVLQNQGANPMTFWLNGTPEFGGYDRAVQIIDVDPSTTYTLKFWLRSGDGLRYSGYAAGNLLVQIEQFSPVPEVIDSMSAYTPLTWGQFQTDFTTGSFCTEIALLFSCYNAAGVDAWVDDVELDIKTDIVEPTKVEVAVYPNPASEEFNIRTNCNERFEIVLYDNTSRKILERTFYGSTVLDLKAFANGLYIYDLKQGETVVNSGKVIKE